MMNSKVIWFTGLSGAGKTTLAKATKTALEAMQVKCIILDGDDIRQALCSDLGFSAIDRSENVRRVAEVARLFVENGFFVLVSLISPYKRDREIARRIIGRNNFYEIYISTALSICEERDAKGLYKKALSNNLQEFTGITSDYEPPDNPALMVDTYAISLDESVFQILGLVRSDMGSSQINNY